MDKYNGWTNYATWRVNLEMFDGMSAEDFSADELPASEFADTIKQYAEDIIFCETQAGLCEDYARAFLSDVNWYEIAQHLLDEVETED